MKVKCIGQSATDVTGSMYLFEHNKTHVLIECGIKQSSKIREDFVENASNFPFKPSALDYIICCHSHIDHIGNIPKLYKDGCTAPIYVPKDSICFMRHLLEDCCYILSKTAKWLDREEIYTMDHVKIALSKMVEVDYYEKVNLVKNIDMEFIPSGHAPSGAQLIIHGQKDRLVYTSDIGNQTFPLNFATPFQPIQSATVAIVETTYGASNKLLEPPNRDKDIVALLDIINSTEGRILVPTFSFCRTQEILKLLYSLREHINIPVYIDSQLSKKITKEYEKLYDIQDMLKWDRLKLVDGWEESVALSLNTSKKIILSSGGMCQNGRITNHLKTIIPCKEDCIVFVGYVSEGVGKNIQEYKPIRIMGEEYERQCKHITLNSFSSHATRQNLLDYYSSINCEKIILVHGSPTAKKDLKHDLEQLFYNKCKTTKVIISEKNLEINI